MRIDGRVPIIEESESPQALLAQVGRFSSRQVWLIDVDDTITNTAAMHKRAAMSTADVVGLSVGSHQGKMVARRFDEVFQVMLASHQALPGSQQPTDEPYGTSSPGSLLRRIAACQQAILHDWGAIKKFSREVLLKLAAEDCDVDLSPEQILSATDHYWRQVDEHTVFIRDTLQLLRTLEGRNCPVYLMTGSDGRLIPRTDGQFTYDPQFSKSDKLGRMMGLRQKGVHFQDVFIGDPVDKPEPQFFKILIEGIQGDLGRRLRSADLVVLGDSYRSDLETPLAQGLADVGVLYVQGQSAPRLESSRVISVGDLSSLIRGR